MQISWEVRNRFRLFREERDFLLHTDSARGRSILASEQALELRLLKKSMIADGGDQE